MQLGTARQSWQAATLGTAEVLDGPGWQKTLIFRNNAMRPPIQFLMHNGDSDMDILQEYFIPVE